MQTTGLSHVTLVEILVLAFPLLVSLIALFTGLVGYRRSTTLPSAKGRTASIVGVALGAFSTLMWATIGALVVLGS